MVEQLTDWQLGTPVPRQPIGPRSERVRPEDRARRRSRLRRRSGHGKIRRGRQVRWGRDGVAVEAAHPAVAVGERGAFVGGSGLTMRSVSCPDLAHVVRCARPAAARAGLPGYDALGPLKLLRTMPDIAGYDHSWFIVTRKIIEREFALSGWEQNPDITNRDYKLLLKSRLGRGPHGRSRRSWTAVPISWSPAIFATGGRYEPPYQ